MGEPLSLLDPAIHMFGELLVATSKPVIRVRNGRETQLSLPSPIKTLFTYLLVHKSNTIGMVS